MKKNLKKESQFFNNEISKNLIKYSSLAIEMMVSIIIMAWLGKKLDKKLNLNYPIFLALFSLSSVIINIYLVIKKLTNINETNINK